MYNTFVNSNLNFPGNANISIDDVHINEIIIRKLICNFIVLFLQ